MMKTSILTWVLTGFSLSLIAQPDIQFVNWGIFIDTYRVNTEDVNPNPVPTGNNVIWDFSSLGGDISDTIVSLGVNSHPYKIEFPTANVTFLIKNTSSTAYHFYRSQNDGLFYEGFAFPSIVVVPYDEEQQILSFPFKFNSSFNDDYQTNTTIKGRIKVTYDGYGTLKLPNIIFTNVYRVKTFDSISTTQYSNSYMFFGENRQYLTILKNSDGTTVTNYYYSSQGLSVTTPDRGCDQCPINVFPNPTRDKVYVKNMGLSQADVKVTIINQMGAVVHEQQVSLSGGQYERMEVQLAPALYYVIISSGKNKYQQKLVVQ